MNLQIEIKEIKFLWFSKAIIEMKMSHYEIPQKKRILIAKRFSTTEK